MYGGDDGFIDFKAESASVAVDYWDGDFSFQILTEDFGSMTMAEAKDIRKCLQAATDAANQGLLNKYLIEVEPSRNTLAEMPMVTPDGSIKPSVEASYQGKSVFPSESDDWWDNPQYISAFTEKSYAISPSKKMFPTVDIHKLQPLEDEEQPCRKPRSLSDYPQPGPHYVIASSEEASQSSEITFINGKPMVKKYEKPRLDKSKLRMLEFVHDQ